jgi:hypothetical protein
MSSFTLDKAVDRICTTIHILKGDITIIVHIKDI